jgi:hypothetical protein
MTTAATPWQAIPLPPYGAVLHIPAGWETLPPRPDNGPEIIRATGGGGRTLIVFKMPVRAGTTPAQVAAGAQERLAAHGYQDFTTSEAEFAGGTAVALDFVTARRESSTPYRSREYFTVRGTAAFALGTGSANWTEYLPVVEELARRFELVGDQPSTDRR